MQSMSVEKKSQLKLLIAQGKEKGYLTYAEVNDHLPDDVVDPEQIEDIINMINDMGIKVHEEAPDDEALLMSDTAVSADDDDAEEAAAALAAVDAEFGRTTDPVRMYMREMGSVGLLNREGEISIAKRIEEGMAEVLYALALLPDTAAGLLSQYARVEEGDAKYTDVIVGFIDPETGDTIKPMSDEEIKEAKEHNAKLAQKKNPDHDERPIEIGPDHKECRKRFQKLEKRYEAAMEAIASRGLKDKQTQALREGLADEFLTFKLAPKLATQLINNMRKITREIRSSEREMMRICVQEGGMDRKEFLRRIPENSTNAEWVEKLIRAKRKYSSTVAANKDEMLRQQERLLNIEAETT